MVYIAFSRKKTLSYVQNIFTVKKKNSLSCYFIDQLSERRAIVH